jgi:anti-anti-sigma factor
MDKLQSQLTQNSNGVWTLKLIGSIGSETYQSIWTTSDSAALLKQLVEANAYKLVIDLSEIERIDSNGLRLLLNAHKEFSKQEISIVLRNPNSHLHRLFLIMQFDRVFNIELQ